MSSVGRTKELHHISLLSAADEESALLVVGPPGSGKTHLLGEALHLSPIQTVLLRTNPVEAGWPLAGVSALLASVNGSQIPDLGDRSRLLASDPQGLFAAASDVLGIVRSLELPPTLALVDDIDLMDAASQLLIGFMASRLRYTGLRIVATATLEHPSPALSRMSRIDLGPLSRADMNRLALQFAAQPGEEGGLFMLAGYADGNPTALKEIIADLGRTELAGLRELTLPPLPRATAHRRASERLAFVSAAGRAVLERLSTAPLTARAVASRDEPAQVDALQDAISSGLVEQKGHYVRVRSSLLRSHLYWSLPAQERRRLHAAEEVASATDPRALLWHSSFSAVNTTLPEQLMQGAVSLAREGATRAATEYAERARSLSEGESFGPELFAELAEALLAEGELARAARYAEVGYRMELPLGTRLRFDWLRMQVHFLRTKQVLDHDFEVWLDDYSAADPDGAGELLLLAAFCRLLRSEPDLAKRHLDRARLLVSDTSVSLTVALRLQRAIAGEPSPDPLSIAPHDLVGWPKPHVLMLALAEMIEGDYAAARRLCELVVAGQPLEPVWSSSAHYFLAEIEIRSGHYVSARTAINRSGIVRGPELRPAYSAPLAAWRACADNQLDEATRIVDAQLGTLEQDAGPAMLAGLHALRGELAILQGDVDGAVIALRRAEALDRELDNPAVMRVFPEFIEVLYRARRLGEAQAEIEDFLARCDRHPSAWATLAQARIAALRASDNEEGFALCDAALAVAASGDASVERARLLVLRAERLDRLGRIGEARLSYLEAREAFSTAGALAWVAYVDRHVMQGELDQHDAGPVALLSRLSDEERRIVDYVKLGYRTKQIALQLHISVRTVELRLTNIYRLANVSSRSDLVARLAS